MIALPAALRFLSRPEPPATRAPRPPGRAPTILLASFDLDTRLICRAVLQYHDIHVIESVNPEAGLRLAREARLDLVVLDVSPPVAHGWELARAFKADPRSGGPPLIVLTADASTAGRAAAREAGCDAYLTKPFSPLEILWEIRHLLRAGTVSVQRDPALHHCGEAVR